MEAGGEVQAIGQVVADCREVRCIYTHIQLSLLENLKKTHIGFGDFNDRFSRKNHSQAIIQVMYEIGQKRMLRSFFMNDEVIQEHFDRYRGEAGKKRM